MSLTLFHHPLSSYCQKALIALYELGVPFDARFVDLGNPEHRAMLGTHWPLVKFPVLHDAARNRSLPESSVIIEYLDHHHPGTSRLIPADWDTAIEVRLWDRIFDNHIQTPMQQIVVDRLQQSNADLSAPRAWLQATYRVIDHQVASGSWAACGSFSLADCAAAPALFYASALQPFPAELHHLAAYFERLMARPSVKRVIEGAEPYFDLFPFAAAIPAKFRKSAAARQGV